MSTDGNNYSKEEWIELYLSGKMNDLERQEIETAMRQDPSLAEEVELMRHIISGFRHKGEIAMIKELKTLSSEEELKGLLQHTEKQISRPVKKSNRRGWYYGGISAVAILWILFIGYQPRYTPSQLYQEYYQVPAYEYFPSRGGVDPDFLQPFISSGVAYYEGGNYPGAADAFEKVIAALPEMDVPEELWYYSAISLVETGQTRIAMQRFERLAACDTCELQEDARWQMTWVYLSSGDRAAARQLLSSILGEETGRYTIQAKELLYRLNQRKWF
ncbi:MAG: tetratricopeptide repeat protein [Bacteroides sp.]|nr:tetratricopeptide repeat protein [Bacteroides sp.]